MPFAGIDIPSIQLALLESYLEERNVKIETLHLYLKAAEIYGFTNYSYLVYPPNDSYTAQMIYSKYIFPEHYQKNKKKFKEYFDITHKKFCFEEYVEKTDNFYNWFFENINWRDFDIIGFSLNYGQFLPSLSFAKKIKEIDSKKLIIFGGSRTTGILGERILETFDFIDYIVSGDGEEPLFNISTKFKNIKEIPGLIYRENGKIISNGINNTTDINILPIPTFDSYYFQLKESNPELKQFFFYNGKLPIELSRGCWWNRCTFCNLNLQYKKYREKNVEKIVEEIEFLSNKYKILNFQIISNTLPAKDHKKLCEKIIQLKKDFTFFAEARADNLKSDDYELLKKAGFTNIQTGIESFSSNYLKKMNKGARVIDNIAALKFCKQNKIKNNYNLLIGYPNEDEKDFEETKNNIKLFIQYLDQPRICNLRIMYGSNIYNNPHEYSIDKLENTSIDKIMYPEDILKKEFNFVYEYKTTNHVNTKRWEKLVKIWKKEREYRQIQNIKNKLSPDEPILYFVDGKNFLTIYDKRNQNSIFVYNLDSLERKILLECIDIASFAHLKLTFKDINEKTIKDILKTFEETGIIFKESEYYLTLPLYNSDRKIIKDEIKEKQDIANYNTF